MTDFRAYAAEYDDCHDKIDDEHELLKALFERLRADVRKEFPDKKDAQERLAEFKALFIARRKFGPTLDGYTDKSERIQNLNDEIFGRSTPSPSNKRTTANPKPIARPSNESLARVRDESAAAFSPPRQSRGSDGAAVSEIALPGTAATNDGGPAAIHNTLPAPLSAAGGGWGAGEPAATRDDAYNAIPEFLART